LILVFRAKLSTNYKNLILPNLLRLAGRYGFVNDPVPTA
jgi:hypothetical protein